MGMKYPIEPAGQMIRTIFKKFLHWLIPIERNFFTHFGDIQRTITWISIAMKGVQPGRTTGRQPNRSHSYTHRLAQHSANHTPTDLLAPACAIRG